MDVLTQPQPPTLTRTRTRTRTPILTPTFDEGRRVDVLRTSHLGVRRA